MSVNILGINCDECVSMVKWCFTSTETVRLFRTESPGRPPRLSHSSWTLNEWLCLFMARFWLSIQVVYLQRSLDVAWLDETSEAEYESIWFGRKQQLWREKGCTHRSLAGKNECLRQQCSAFQDSKNNFDFYTKLREKRVPAAIMEIGNVKLV